MHPHFKEMTGIFFFLGSPDRGGSLRRERKAAEKEQLEEMLPDVRFELVTRRDEGLSTAVRLQTEEGQHALETFVSFSLVQSL